MDGINHDEVENAEPEALTRRRSLVRLGGLFAAALGAGGLAKAADSDAAGEGPAGVASGAVTCVLTPEQTEGPYYIDGETLRRNITEGRPGMPLTLRLKVVNASTCKAIRGALVDIWHADAAGVYSGFGSGASSRTFMRGIQRTNVQGLAIFKTVYPGWYPGRTVHIHVKVHLGGDVVHTGQLYFADAVTDAVYRGAPYASRPGRSTRNSSDAIFRNGGSRSMLSLRKDGSGYVGSISMGVVRR
jgi:protocatechuate 3,4-dioxygenase beta subunit